MRDLDRFFQENKKPFGVTPIGLVSDIPKYVSNGNVLDLGAGTGRNSLFLAKSGFNVTAQDISEIALEQLTEMADEMGVRVKTEAGDLNNIKIDEIYDILINIYVLHFLQPETALRLIDQMQSHTSPNGINAIATFTRGGDYYRANPDKQKFFPKKDELLNLYVGWKILRHEKIMTQASVKKDDGSVMINEVEWLLVQKSN